MEDRRARNPGPGWVLAAFALGALDGAIIGGVVNAVGWFLHENLDWFRWLRGGPLWALGGGVAGVAVTASLLTRRGLVTDEIRHYAVRLSWLRVAVVALAINVLSAVTIIQLLASVTLAVAVTIGYFIEANALFRLAPERFRLFATLTGGLLGVAVGGLANSQGWFKGGWLWPAAGLVLGALAGRFVWGRRPDSGNRGSIPERAAPVIFLAPVMVFVGVTLVVPTIRTIYLSFRGRRSDEFVGAKNYRDILGDDRVIGLGGFGDLFTSRLFIAAVVVTIVGVGLAVLLGLGSRRGVDLSAPLPSLSLTASAALVMLALMSALSGVIWNNVYWIVFVAGLATALGLAIAMLADRSRGESVAKSLIFMPMAISFVGASVIWRFVYAAEPAGREQIGVLNAVWVNFGGDPQEWLQNQPWNNLFLIAIMIWIQTGFAMVILSAAIKGVPEELREAARVDGASEMQTFWRVTLPHIRPTVVVVVTTLVVTVLKVYDIVQVMTGGLHNTNVVANQMFDQVFQAGDLGRGSVLAVVLFIGVVPLMIVNILRVRRQEEVR